MIYFIRHAITRANLSGSMVNGYAESGIMPFDSVLWRNTVGKHIKSSAERRIYSSPTVRCVQTASVLYNRLPDSIIDELSEFDCKDLGDLKFWEITEEQFSSKVHISPDDMADKARRIIDICGSDDCIAVTHGMVIRYMWHYMNGNPEISAYGVINSSGFTFSNLDVLAVDPCTKHCDVYRFGQPVNHKE